MVRKGRFGTGGSGSNAAGDVIKNILSMQESGETAAPAGTTDGTAKKPPTPGLGQLKQTMKELTPDYSGLDLTGLSKQEANKLKKSVRTPEYTAAKRAYKTKKEQLSQPYTDKEISSNAARRSIAGGITYEQALADYRKLARVLNLVPAEGSTRTAKQEKRFQRLNAALTPQQKASQQILGILGAYGGPNAKVYERLGLPVPTQRYGRLEDSTAGGKIRINNPLSQQQRSRLQRLRSAGSLSDRQKQALARLRMKKNAPNPYTGE